MQKVVYKDNALIQASYKLTVLEQRLILSCISQIRHDEKVTDETLYTVHAKDLVLDSDKGEEVYTRIKEVAEQLHSRLVRIHLKPNGEGKREQILLTRWVQSVMYTVGTGTIQVRFSRDILPYLNQLKGHFTKYAYSDIACMSSAYAIRLYELMSQYAGLGERYITLEQLRECLELKDEYKSTYEFKRRVLDPAVKQINELTDYKVSYKARKQGRQIVGYDFTIKQPRKTKQAAKQAPKVASKVIYNQRDVAHLAKEGETWAQLLDRLKKDGYTFKFKPNYTL